MNGNFGGTLDIRLSAADTVVFFDLSPLICVWRVIKRRMRYHNKSRPDMGEGCIEQLDFEFIHFILSIYA
jgi:adenylate kinase family enzyme